MTDTFDIACCIRNGSSGWFILDDSDHAPINVTSISVVNGSSAANGYVQINYPTATKVGALIVGQDESCAQNGYTAGASVDFANSKIRFALNGAAIAPNSMPSGNYNFWIIGKMIGSVTPSGPEQKAYQAALNTNEAGWDGYNFRLKVMPSNVPSGTPTLSIPELTAATNASMSVASAYIGHAATSGNGWKFASTPIQLKSATNGSFSLSSSQVLTLDQSNFVWDKTSPILLHFYLTDADAIRRINATGAGSIYYKLGADDGATLDPSGYTGSASNPNCAGILSAITMDGY